MQEKLMNEQDRLRRRPNPERNHPIHGRTALSGKKTAKKSCNQGR